MNRSTIYLAALLHDIGKFYQRADDNGTASSKILSPETKKNEGLYCPQYQGRYSHKHVLWTAEFLDGNRSFFESVLGKSNYEPFFKAAVKHHAPDQNDVFQVIVQQADHYSSGVDRSGEAGQRDAAAENAWDSFKNVRMVSIFEGLLREKNYVHKRSVPIMPLSLHDDHFPAAENEKTKGQVSYAELWKRFDESFQQLKESNCNVESLGENLTFLLYRFACSVPSSTMHLPDVSLYDHLKSTGIFALCLHDYLTEKQMVNANFKIEDDEAPFLLVGGDLSGIQNYIYDIVSTDAARNLKGRSFYLQILVENAVELILKNLQLPWASVVYASGGGFYLLAPNTEKVREMLKATRKTLSDGIFKAHQTNLSLNIDWQEVTHHQIMHQEINKVWGALSRKIAVMKGQKFKSNMVDSYAYFFDPSEIGGKQQRDHITGEEFTEAETKDINEKRFSHSVRSIDGNMMKESTYSQIELGKDLRNTQYWITTHYAVPQWKKHEYQICDIGIYNYLFSQRELMVIGHRNPDDAFVRTFDVDKSGFDPDAFFLKGNRCVHGFTFYGGNDYPEKSNGEPTTFTDMANFLDEGTNKLGVLRMDVDNLGSIFIKGLDDKQRTFSRYSVLSRNLDFFFKGYLNRIWANGKAIVANKNGESIDVPFVESCSIIYSGGDDLFIVGHWSAVFAFAEQIKNDFARWVCHNLKLTISGGIALTGGSFPISKGTDFAAEAEKKAKGHKRRDDLDKNAITLFNVPLGWDKEFPMVQSLKHLMVDLINRKKIPRGVLQKMLNYGEQARVQTAKGGSTPWRWHMAYDFSRAIGRNRDIETKDFFEMIQNAAITGMWSGEYIGDFSHHSFLDLLEVAARWAELETKS